MEYRLHYKEVGGKVAITSPDLPGLHVVGDTAEDAARHLDRSIKRILTIRRRRLGDQNSPPEEVSVVPLVVSVEAA